MAIEATFTATEGEFPLAAVFSEFPTAEVVVPYFWVRHVDIEKIPMENVTHPASATFG